MTEQKSIRALILTLMVSLLAMLLNAIPAGAARSATITPVRPLGTVNVRNLASSAKTTIASSSSGHRVAMPMEAGPKGPESRGHIGLARTVRNTLLVPDRGPARVFDGLSHADQRLARDGNQYASEPPDGALCQGNGAALEMVNGALQFFDAGGTQLTPPIALSAFWGLPPAIDYTSNPPTYPGPILTDVKCLLDAATGRLFLLVWGLSQDPNTGGFNGHNIYFVAVGNSSDPLSDYHRYALEVSPPDALGCPCLADHPTAGADANAFVIAYNEYQLSPAGIHFNGAKLLALSKSRLEEGETSPAIQLEAGSLGGGRLYTLQPGNVPPRGRYEAGNRGTLWFLSALEFTGTGDTRVAVEALTGTDELETDPGAVTLHKAIVQGVLPYVSPPKAQQRAGLRPLGEAVNEPLPKLDSGLDEAQPTKFAAGHLWTVIDTQVGSGAGARAGLLYLQVRPRFVGNTIAAKVTHQGYVAVRGANLLYGDIAVTAAGKSLIVASLVGPNHYPSAVYGMLHPSRGVSRLHVYLSGHSPEDGFSCYQAFAGPEAAEHGCRWGDYSEATVGTDGAFWFETEYTAPGLRTIEANWGTALGRVQT